MSVPGNRRDRTAAHRFGADCADAMINSRRQELRQTADGTVESAANILAISQRKDWSVESGGDFFYRKEYVNTVSPRLSFEYDVFFTLSFIRCHDKGARKRRYETALSKQRHEASNTGESQWK